MRRLAEAVRKGNIVVAHRRSLLNGPDKFAVLAQRTQHADPLSVWLWLATVHLLEPRLAVQYGRLGTKARFVKVE